VLRQRNSQEDKKMIRPQPASTPPLPASGRGAGGEGFERANPLTPTLSPEAGGGRRQKMLRLTEPLTCAKCAFRFPPRGRHEDHAGAARHKLLGTNDFGKEMSRRDACAFCAVALQGLDVRWREVLRVAPHSPCNHPLCICPFRCANNGYKLQIRRAPALPDLCPCVRIDAP